jgi:hypothetical protein
VVLEGEEKGLNFRRYLKPEHFEEAYRGDVT